MSDRPYVDLHEAVRVVVRLMPDGTALASKITNEWIMEGYRRFDAPEDDPDDFMVRVYGPDWRSGPDWESARPRVIAAYDAAAESMVRLYGNDWREMRPRIIAAFDKAVGLLRGLLRTGRVHGVGVSDTIPKIGSREIAPYEWSSLQLNISRQILEAADYPAIRRVFVSRKDLICEATALLSPPTLAPPAPGKQLSKRTSPKQLVVVSVLKRIYPTGVPDRSQVTDTDLIQVVSSNLPKHSATSRDTILRAAGRRQDKD